MATKTTEIETTPGESYQAQRARGFRRLRFAPSLEREYLSHMRLDQRTGTLICSVTALVIWLVFSALDLRRLDIGAEFNASHLDAFFVMSLRSFTMVMLIALVVVSYRRRLPRTYHWLSAFCLFLIGVSAAIAANVYKMRDLPQADLANFAIIMAVFLPLGLTFYQSIATALAIVLFVTLSGVLMLDAPLMAEHLRLSVMLFFAAFVGAVGAYLREHAQRDQFLLRRLLHYHAMQDPLTGIGNRRHFEQQARIALDQARRDGVDVVMAVLDVDHFKRFNDRYGHHTGDKALKRVADTIKASIRRPMDLVGRLGGEEFGILCYDANPENAHTLLRRIVTSIEELAIVHDASTTARMLTVSIGAAVFDHREALENLYRRADAVLYEAKEAGRNRVHLDTSNSIVPMANRHPRLLRKR